MARGRTSDYYATLGVSRKADAKEIKAAFRKLARQYHPDVNPGDAAAEAKFKEVQAAYDVLGDEEKRALYDRYGSDWEAAAQGGAGGYVGDVGGVRIDAGPFGSIFDQFFGGSGGAGFTTGGMFSRRAAQDVEVAAEVSLFEVESGTSRTIRYQVEDACGNCRGSGQVRTTDQRMMYCPVCGGTGVQARNRSVTVQIPAGVEDGQRLRVSKGGSEGGDGRTGDLFVVVAVSPHPQFKRRGADLEIEIDVDYVVAALGGVVRVPTLTSSGQMNLPAGTPTGRLVRLKGKGLPGKGGSRGDLLARVRVTVPDDLSDEERKLLEKIQALRGGTA